MIVWLLMMGLLGFPLLFITLSLGYFSGKNIVDLWEAVPLFKGKRCVKTRPIIDLSLFFICKCTSVQSSYFWSYFIAGVGFIQLFSSWVMAWYYPVIGSYSFTYLADAMVSGNDQLQNGSAYIDCYNYQGR